MLAEFTSPDEIRAVFGVSDDEIEDATILLPLYETLLIDDLELVGTGLVTAFRTVSLIDLGTRSSVQRRFYDMTRLFSAYSIAKQLLTALPYFAEMRMTDGQAEKQRIAKQYEMTRDGVLGMYEDLRLRLSAAFVGVAGGTIATRILRTYTLATGLAVDPVVGA